MIRRPPRSTLFPLHDALPIYAGGVFVMNVYDRSEYTVTTAGMISPSSLAVRALKFLQKSMILTPCGPSAVPTGGAGVAFPAAIWSFTIACTFFAMMFLPPEGGSHK